MATVATLSDTTIVGENEEQLVTMIVDNQLFGVPILQVQDIVEASKITPVPLAPSAIAGVLNLRGRIVTVIDLRKILGNDEEVPWESQMGVTIEHKGDLYTLLVDAIGDVRTLPKRDFDSAPSTMDEKVRQLCSGIFRLRGNLLVVLDVARILQPEVIDATPTISVDERRARKLAAVGSAGDTKAEGGRQLSSLMTDLNAYESDFDSGLDSLSSEEDDIKARKKANRSRRPVNERWREVLEEKARKDGSTVYRMREPDEEVLEEAREQEKQIQAEWEAEWRERQEGTYVSRLDKPEDAAGSPHVADESAPSGETTGFDAPSGDDGSIPSTESEASDWWSRMRGKSGQDEGAADPAADEAPAEPVVTDEAMPETPVAKGAPVELPAAEEPAAETPVSDEPAAEAAPAEEEKAEDTTGGADKKSKRGSSKGKSSSRSRKKK